MGEKQYETEWEFSFDKIGDKIRGAVGSLDFDEEVKFASFSEAIDDAVAAKINLHFSVGEITIKALGESDNLLEADVSYLGEIDFEVAGDTDKTVTLRQKKHKSFFGNLKGLRNDDNNKLHWDVRLSKDVPINLNVHGGVGEIQLDLQELQLSNLKLHGGVGEFRVNLPESQTPYAVHINGGVGEVAVNAPENTTVDIHVKGGVGEVRVALPEGVAARAMVKSGIGDVDMPKSMEKISGGRVFLGVKGKWETNGFDEAENKVTIRYKGGIGSFEVVDA